MRSETSMLVQQHMAYLQADEKHVAEMRQFETLYDHMQFFFTTKLGLLPDTAQGIVDDFKDNLMNQPDI